MISLLVWLKVGTLSGFYYKSKRTYAGNAENTHKKLSCDPLFQNFVFNRKIPNQNKMHIFAFLPWFGTVSSENAFVFRLSKWHVATQLKSKCVVL